MTTVNEIQVSYRARKSSKEYPVVTTSDSAHDFLRSLFCKKTIRVQEEFVVLYLNQGNRVVGVFRLSKGGITSTTVDIRLVLSVALKSLSTGIIMAHNHPSGNLKPSNADEVTTLKIKEAGNLTGIRLIDHLILSPWGEYLSMADVGLI